MYGIIRKSFFLSFRKTETELHPLRYLFWECTTRCNLDCLHCGSDCSADGAHRDMPLTDFLAALDTIESKSDDLIVVLTGGEPLLRKDIEECGREIRKREMRWGMVSNGYLYNRENHVALLNAGMGSLTLSLDGLEDNHNWLRNNKKSFSRVGEAITLAAGAPRLNFDVVTCVNNRNLHELPLLYDYLAGKGVKAWRLFTIVPIGRAENNPDLLLSDLQFQQMLDFICSKRKLKLMDVKFSCEGYVGRYETKVRDGFFFCRAGINIASMLADGSISACPNLRENFIQGNVYKDNFMEVWENRFQIMRNRSWTNKGVCKDCKFYKYCLGNGLHLRDEKTGDLLFCHLKRIEEANQ